MKPIPVLDEIFHNYHGVMIGSGPNIWIRQVGNRYAIYGVANAAFLEKTTGGWKAPATRSKKKMEKRHTLNGRK